MQVAMIVFSERSFGVLPASTAVLYDHGNNAGGPYPSRGNGNIANDGLGGGIFNDKKGHLAIQSASS